ncbi:MAG: hypothetical protein BMS9Abin34_197 [Patescibacteria group bacterium]|nr:MAG: hypothetical protein BMS9Abin34_197 [Patescibacteria group bacterium]
MTLDELKENWKLYAVELPDGTIKPLKEVFVICLGNYLGGLIFDPGGEQGAEATILKPDEEGNCYFKSDPSAPEDAGWELLGRFVELEEA